MNRQGRYSIVKNTMASNESNEFWCVKITPLPTSITINELSQTFNLPSSRIKIPRGQKTATYYAWINEFDNEITAKDFTTHWSGASVFGATIKCQASKSKRDSPNTPNVPSVLPKSSVPDRPQSAAVASPDPLTSKERPRSGMPTQKAEASGNKQVYSNLINRPNAVCILFLRHIRSE